MTLEVDFRNLGMQTVEIARAMQQEIVLGKHDYFLDGVGDVVCQGLALRDLPVRNELCQITPICLGENDEWKIVKISAGATLTLSETPTSEEVYLLTITTLLRKKQGLWRIPNKVEWEVAPISMKGLAEIDESGEIISVQPYSGAQMSALQGVPLADRLR